MWDEGGREGRRGGRKGESGGGEEVEGEKQGSVVGEGRWERWCGERVGKK